MGFLSLIFGVFRPGHPLSGYVWLAVLAGLVVSHGYVYMKGVNHAESSVMSKMAKAQHEAAQAKQELQNERAKRVVDVPEKFRTVTKVIERNVIQAAPPADCNLDDISVRAYNALFTGNPIWSDAGTADSVPGELGGAVQ